MVRLAHLRLEGGSSLSTPAQLGYRMPAEWEPHAGTWLTWPRREGISFPDLYDRIPPILAAMVRALAEDEGVFINVWDATMEAEVRSVLTQHDALNDRVEFHHHPAYEPWCRDHGPVFVVNTSQRAVLNWGYNAWGEKYPPYDLDNAVPEHIASVRGLPCFTPDMILEGGSIEVNGQGTLITTESCLLNPNRNPALDRAAIEQRLSDYLGVRKVLWLGEGIAGDDTDGHVDDLTRFVDAQTVVTAVEPDSQHPNHPPLQVNLQRLQAMCTQDGDSLRVIELPMPKPVLDQGERLPASYANFYIGNRTVLMPAFGQSRDADAQAILQQCFPSRRVLPLDSTDLIRGLGSFHCLTQQEPWG
ncbi:MAG: agmatine/peptidylarginine deiminase [Limisphaerales bacterium]|jgi:agmatine deiminase